MASPPLRRSSEWIDEAKAWKLPEVSISGQEGRIVLKGKGCQVRVRHQFSLDASPEQEVAKD